METTKPADELSSTVPISSKDVKPLASQGHSHMPCSNFGDFFRCPTPPSCSKNQECLRAWMQRAKEST